MKRLIKYWNQYESDKHNFSTCSTKYEVLPHLVEDSAGIAELKEYASKLNLKVKGTVTSEALQYSKSLYITHALKLTETHTVKGMFSHNDDSVKPVWLGFITLPISQVLEPIVLPNQPVSLEQAQEIVNNQELGVQDVGEHQNGGIVVIKSGWEYYHELPLLGYSLESFQTVLGITTGGFDDDTFRCDVCGIYDDQTSDGYTNNHRIDDDSCEQIGINCRCWDEHCKSPDFIESIVNHAHRCIELDTAKELEKDNKLVFIERFISGMTDGRDGYFAGKSTREGSPESVLQELLKNKPNGKYIFSHDESGQFQTYFSVWQVKSERKPRKSSKRS